jgi:hypothetical protein
MIGRRLRKACGAIANDLPTAIADKLAALREAEVRRAAMDGSADNAALGAGSGVLGVSFDR